MRRLPPKYDPGPIIQSDGETNDPLIADHRNFYPVETCTKDGSRVDRMLFAGSNLVRRERSSTGRSSVRPRGQQDVAEVSTALRVVLLYRPLLKPLGGLGQEELD